jgi:AraC-like DNA-binding protein
VLRSGLLTVDRVGGRTGELTLDPTRALMTRDRSVRLCAPDGADARCLVVSVSADALADRATDASVAFSVAPRLLLRFQRLRCRSLWQRRAAVEGDRRQLGADALALVQHSLHEPTTTMRRRAEGAVPPSPAHRELAWQTREILAAAPGASHPLATLARRVGTSPFHLAHVFGAVMGVSVHRYLVQLRLATALERLADGEDSLSALALDLGFSTHSHFTSVFRRCLGMTPREARAALIGGRVAPLTLDRRATRSMTHRLPTHPQHLPLRRPTSLAS